MTDTCSHCGKQLLAPKRCSICKQASYYTRRRVGRKKHKKTCEPPVPLKNVLQEVKEAGVRLLIHHSSPHYDPSVDWQEVLKWEGRLTELMATEEDVNCDFFLQAFKISHMLERDSTGSLRPSGRFSPGDARKGESHHSTSIHALDEHRIGPAWRQESLLSKALQGYLAHTKTPPT